MSNELIIKKCKSCGALVQVIHDCTCENCGIKCCGEEMQALIPNSADASAEKHVPVYDVDGDKIIVKLNHPMEDEHFIEWVTLVNNNKKCSVYFDSNKEAICEFKYIPGSTIYAYCNKHGLWKKDVN